MQNNQTKTTEQSTSAASDSSAAEREFMECQIKAIKRIRRAALNATGTRLSYAECHALMIGVLGNVELED